MRDLSYDQYVREQTAINSGLSRLLVTMLSPFLRKPVSDRDWTYLLAAMYPHVRDARIASSALAREFYDSERRRFVPKQDVLLIDSNDTFIRVVDDAKVTVKRDVVHPMPLEDYKPDWFEQAMRPVKGLIRKDGSSPTETALTAATAVKEAENGGRRTILRAAPSDKQIRGWARVEGTENVGSCGFCLMLISRGPVYFEARDAGFDVSNTRALDIFQKAQDTGDEAVLNALMTRWHPHCDCKVVPVFKNATDWPGRDQYVEADRIWREATKGYDYTEALNALRRYLYSGRHLDTPQRVSPAA